MRRWQDGEEVKVVLSFLNDSLTEDVWIHTLNLLAQEEKKDLVVDF